MGALLQKSSSADLFYAFDLFVQVHTHETKKQNKTKQKRNIEITNQNQRYYSTDLRPTTELPEISENPVIWWGGGEFESGMSVKINWYKILAKSV